MKITMILLVISIICLIVSLCLFIRTGIKARRNKKDIPDEDGMTLEEVIDTLNEVQKDTLYFLVDEAVKEAKQEPTHVETFHTEPVVLTARFDVDYTMLNHMDEDDIHDMIVERFARDFGNYIVENQNLYFMTDCYNPMTKSKVFEARVRIVPWK